jgi:hypothetical protein
MAKDTERSMPAAPRHVYGPRPVSLLIPALTRPTYRRRAPATAQVLADWDAIVGPAIGRVTVPQRLHGGTLSIACAGPVAMELQHLAPELLARINAHLGRPVVERLRFVQDSPPPPRPAIPLSPPSPAAREEAERAVASLPSGELRDALASLGRAVLEARTRPPTRSSRKT